MTQDSRIGPELLKQNGIDRLQLLNEERAAIKELLDRERRRARNAKWTALVSFAVFVGCIATLFLFWILAYQGANPSPPPSPGTQKLAGALTVACVLLPVPAFLVGCISGVLALVYSRSADRQALLAHLAQVETILRRPQTDAKSAPEPRHAP